jgi:hypothetical protein
VEYGIQHQHIVQVRAACVRIVVQKDVAVADVVTEATHDLGGRVRNGEDVDGVVVQALGNEPAVGRNQPQEKSCPS